MTGSRGLALQIASMRAHTSEMQDAQAVLRVTAGDRYDELLAEAMQRTQASAELNQRFLVAIMIVLALVVASGASKFSGALRALLVGSPFGGCFGAREGSVAILPAPSVLESMITT